MRVGSRRTSFPSVVEPARRTFNHALQTTTRIGGGTTAGQRFGKAVAVWFSLAPPIFFRIEAVLGIGNSIMRAGLNRFLELGLGGMGVGRHGTRNHFSKSRWGETPSSRSHRHQRCEHSELLVPLIFGRCSLRSPRVARKWAPRSVAPPGVMAMAIDSLCVSNPT